MISISDGSSKYVALVWRKTYFKNKFKILQRFDVNKCLYWSKYLLHFRRAHRFLSDHLIWVPRSLGTLYCRRPNPNLSTKNNYAWSGPSSLRDRHFLSLSLVTFLFFLFLSLSFFPGSVDRQLSISILVLCSCLFYIADWGRYRSGAFYLFYSLFSFFSFWSIFLSSSI